MSTQLPLPASWAVFESRRDPRERLTALHRDMALTRAKIRDALDELAAKHGVSKRDVTYAKEGYADNLLGDVVYNIEGYRARDQRRDGAVRRDADGVHSLSPRPTTCISSAMAWA